MSSEIEVEKGTIGRAIFARLRPEQDLVEGIEVICRDAGFDNAILRGSLGSVNHPVLLVGSREIEVPHYGLEITALLGEVREGKASLTGSMVNGEGRVFSGAFKRGVCAICVTAELTIEEWVSHQD